MIVITPEYVQQQIKNLDQFAGQMFFSKHGDKELRVFGYKAMEIRQNLEGCSPPPQPCDVTELYKMLKVMWTDYPQLLYTLLRLQKYLNKDITYQTIQRLEHLVKYKDERIRTLEAELSKEAC